jgi:hypothetical protein
MRYLQSRLYAMGDRFPKKMAIIPRLVSGVGSDRLNLLKNILYYAFQHKRISPWRGEVCGKAAVVNMNTDKK